ncbi:Hsp20/alpha crystallin family protein [Actinomadura rudentiformis]|uniref:Hsp20/alpha crystallin family protein n=1 Tax=Actinomadura rudentiformis TaxID=359158 RepID=A0A6H9YQ64_9ACTN|nr:Hsp20/alpha crystallin family protein [Actinomadura rudentiformis]KAB2342197.1 Hsp20/alpha crystallin family protein [Actinomadura rudentiformis]
MLTSLDTLFDEFERQFDRLRTATGLAGGAAVPMDGVRRAEDVLLRFDVPGIDPDSIEVTIDRGVLTVSASRQEAYGENERLFVRERPMGTFTRQVYLSEHLDAEHIEAAYDNGVVAVRIPVLEPAKPRKIEIVKGKAKAITR